MLHTKACSRIPGYIYLALGDPLQKRNYYRAGWLRFQDDADMAAVIAELSEKKVYFQILAFVHTLIINSQSIRLKDLNYT